MEDWYLETAEPTKNWSEVKVAVWLLMFNVHYPDSEMCLYRRVHTVHTLWFYDLRGVFHFHGCRNVTVTNTVAHLIKTKGCRYELFKGNRMKLLSLKLNMFRQEVRIHQDSCFTPTQLFYCVSLDLSVQRQDNQIFKLLSCPIYFFIVLELYQLKTFNRLCFLVSGQVKSW